VACLPDWADAIGAWPCWRVTVIRIPCHDDDTEKLSAYLISFGDGDVRVTSLERKANSLDYALETLCSNLSVPFGQCFFQIAQHRRSYIAADGDPSPKLKKRSKLWRKEAVNQFVVERDLRLIGVQAAVDDYVAVSVSFTHCTRKWSILDRWDGARCWGRPDPLQSGPIVHASEALQATRIPKMI
jgi:hypothetical protein